ncbi:MAG: hypothetical protein GYA63_03095 [Armatimonadetes bacterium]|nr:hypothetical protein [Armatimonadota bacterium]HOC32136.1 hypothetical protein [Armatimonadota bacterium]
MADEKQGGGFPANTHVHLPPNFSAFSSVRQAVDLAVDAGLSVLGASNYYDFRVYREFARYAGERGIFPLFGLEIVARDEELAGEGVLVNDPGNPGKVYLCGKGITRFVEPSPTAKALLTRIRAGDAKRMAEMVRRMSALFEDAGIPTGLADADIITRVADNAGCPVDHVVLQERHVARAFQEALFESAAEDRWDAVKALLGEPVPPRRAQTVQNDIRSRFMKAGRPAFVEESYVSVEEAVLLVRELGGLPCYPVLADGATPISRFEETPEALAENIARWGIRHAEFIPNRNEPEVLRRYAFGLREADILVTAGTEHNTPDLIPIVPACKGGVPIPEDVADLFREGTEALVTHQKGTEQ